MGIPLKEFSILTIISFLAETFLAPVRSSEEMKATWSLSAKAGLPDFS
jgi:hypothetical protein